LFLVTQALVMGTIYLSITVIVGLAGQISLCQGAFAASGAFAAYQLSDNVPGLVAILIGAFIAAALAAVLSLPIRRLGGIWTAVATLAFAYFFDSVIAKLSWVSGGTDTIGNGTAVSRPHLGPFDLNSDKSFLVLCLVVLVLLALAVTALRHSGFGKTLIALRGSEVAAQSIGISPARSRLVAFAISGFIAAIGGGLLSMLGRDVHYDLNFTPFAALFWVVIVVVLGARSVQGAINAGASFSLFSPVILQGTFLAWILRSPDRIPGLFPVSGEWMFILFGLAAIQFAHHPEGLIEHGEHQRAARAAKRAAKKRAAAEATARTTLSPTRTEEPVA
jgi:ABC-type branched-subunit amino acid transport system permease subunit